MRSPIPGAPAFGPKRSYVASATGFPPTSAMPGATAGSGYTPFLKIGSAIVNAPIVATGNGPFDVRTHADTEDRVVAIDTVKKTVTLALVKGFFDGKRVVYLSTEASDPGAATVERATYVPALKARAGIVPIDVVANGSRQGLGVRRAARKSEPAGDGRECRPVGLRAQRAFDVPGRSDGRGLLAAVERASGGVEEQRARRPSRSRPYQPSRGRQRCERNERTRRETDRPGGLRGELSGDRRHRWGAVTQFMGGRRTTIERPSSRIRPSSASCASWTEIVSRVLPISEAKSA